MLTGGQRHDSTRAIALTEGFKYKRAVCDNAYDLDEFIEYIIASGAEPVILPRSKRRIQREYDRHIYKERHPVECLFSKLKISGVFFRDLTSSLTAIPASFILALFLATLMSTEPNDARIRFKHFYKI